MSLEFFDISTLPLPYILAILTGYVLACILAEDTSFWRTRQTFEKLLIGGALGFGLLYGIGFPIVTVASYFVPSLFDQPIEVSAYFLVVVFLYLPLSARIGKISRRTILKVFGYLTQFFPFAIILIFFMSYLFSLGIEVYPDYLQVILKPISRSLVEKTVLAFFFSYLNALTYYFFVNPLLDKGAKELPERDMRWGKKSIKKWNEKFAALRRKLSCKWTTIRFRYLTNKRIVLVLLLLILTLSPIIVTRIDNNYHFVTAKLQEYEEEKFSSSWAKPELVMNITQELIANRFTCQYYELRFKSYDVMLPTFPYSLNSIWVVNPSNCSTLGNFGIPEPYISSLGQVRNLWLTCDENISTTFLSDSKDVEGMKIDFSNVSSQTFSFNVTYFQQFNSRNVTFDYDIEEGEWQNNTKIDTYKFYVHNNENATLKIPKIEIAILSVADCVHDEVEIYLNDSPILRSVDSIAIYPASIQIQPYSFGNITVLIPRQMSQES